MKAKQLAEELLKYPDFNVRASLTDYDNTKQGYAALHIRKFEVEIGDIGHSDKDIILDLNDTEY